VGALLCRGASAGAVTGTSLDPTEYYENLRVGDYANPSATFLGGNSGSFSLPCVPNDVFATQACASVTFNNSPVMSLSASVSAYGIDSSGQTHASTWSELTAEVAYFYAIQGPVTGSPIPLVLDTYVSMVSSGGAHTSITGTARTRLDGVTAQGFNVAAYADSSASRPSSNYRLYTYAQPGVQYDIALIAVDLRVYNYGNLGTEPVGTATVFIDPILSFAPGFDSTGYSLVFGPDVNNGVDASAPEPSTLAMLGAAALLLLARLIPSVRRQFAA